MSHPVVRMHWRILVCAAAALATLELSAQDQTASGAAGNFSQSEYFDAPHQNQMKFLLTGAGARQISNGKLLITGMKLQTFRETGENEINVEAPECLYDISARTAGSPGHLRLQTGDGRFVIEGEGFLWIPTPSLLTISNQVHASVRRIAPKAGAASIEPPLNITSRRFEFDLNDRRAVFTDDVRGDDPEMEFACGLLTASASTNGGSFSLIVAEKEASITSKADGRKASADRAVYTRVDERVELAGNAGWQLGRQSGRADRAIVHRLDQSFEADGHVALKLPIDAIGFGGLFFASTNPPAGPAETSSNLFDLLADHFRSQSNLTVASGSVRLADATNRLACEVLTARSVATNSLEESAIAEQGVIVERPGGRIQADRAGYVKSTDRIVFTGSPRWVFQETEGQADRVAIRGQTGDTEADGNVDVRIPLRGQAGAALNLFPGTTNADLGPQVIEIFAQRFEAGERRAVFLGDARAHETPITGSERRLRSELLEMNLAAGGRKLERITATNHVVFEEGTAGATNGPDAYRRLTADSLAARPSPIGGSGDLDADGNVQFDEPGSRVSGDHATYSGSTDVVRVTGHPILTVETRPDSSHHLLPGVITVSNASVLVWSRGSGHVSAVGSSVRFQPRAVKAAGATP